MLEERWSLNERHCAIVVWFTNLLMLEEVLCADGIARGHEEREISGVNRGVVL